MADQRLKDLRGTNRRDFLKWGATAAACLGLERSRFLNVINDTAGSAAADTIACANTSNLISIVDDSGGMANWTLPYPVPAVVQGNNPQFSHYAIGKGVAAQGYDKPWVNVPETPHQTNSNWKMSAFVAGRNETHTRRPVSNLALGSHGPASTKASPAFSLPESGGAVQTRAPRSHRLASSQSASLEHCPTLVNTLHAAAMAMAGLKITAPTSTRRMTLLGLTRAPSVRTHCAERARISRGAAFDTRTVPPP